MTWLEIVLGVILLLAAIAIILVVLGQEGRRSGVAGAIGGGAETFLSKNKARKLSGKLRSWTKWLAILFIVLVLVVNVIMLLK